MQRWLQRNRNEHGEWSLRDIRLGYRICKFNGHAHAGVHVHHEESDLLEALEVQLEAHEALNLIYHYHRDIETFDWDALKKMVNEWRSQ